MATKDLRIHLPTVYGSSYEDAGKTVFQKYGLSYTTKLQWAWADAKRKGLTAAQFEATPVTQAEANDAARTQEAPGHLASGYLNTYTLPILPKGKFPATGTIQIARGGLVGEGCFGYEGSGGDQGQVATEFVMQDGTGAATWIDKGTERRLFETPNASLAGNMAYNEAFVLEGIKASGPMKKGDGITRIGFYIRRPGSVSWINRLVANGFNKGFVNIDGVPVVYGTIKAFYNDIAGWSGEGTWGADITILKLESDANGRAFQLIPSTEGNAGGVMKIGLKLEDGVTAGIPWPGTIAGWLEGQYCVDVYMNASYQSGVKPQHLFVVNPTLGGGANQSSLLTVQGKGYGYGKILKNNVTGSEWNGPGDYAAYRFEHYAANDTLTTGCPTISKVGGFVPPVDPPPTTGTTTVWPGGAVNSNTIVHLTTPITTTKVTVTKLKTTALSYGRLLGTGPGKASIQLHPDGFFYLNVPNVSSTRVSTAKVVSGVAWSGVLTVPSTTFTDVWQTDPAQGGAIVCTCDKVVLG